MARETVVAQLLLKHRDRRPRITLLALGDRDAGVEIDRGATPRILAKSELLDERLAVGRVAHFGLRVAACGDAHASDQRRDRSDEESDGLVHVTSLLAVCQERVIAAYACRGT
jgi:hypothetical protein